MAETIPTNPMVLRREYLNTAQEIVRRPTEQALGRLVVLTEAMLRDLTQEPGLRLVLCMPDDADADSIREGAAA